MRTRALLLALSLHLAGCSAAEPRSETEPLVVTVVVPPSAAPPASSSSARPTTGPASTTSSALTENTVTNLRAMVTEQCDTSAPGIQKVELDLDNDGVPEIVERREGGRAVCRRIDYSHDGVPDETRFFEADGTVRRLERDGDGDGAVDEIIIRSGNPPACVSMIDSDRDGMADRINRVECPKR